MIFEIALNFMRDLIICVHLMINLNQIMFADVTRTN